MKSIILFVLTITCAVAIMTIAQPGLAQVPRMVSYQGVLSDVGGTPVADASYSLTFKLYATPSGGSAIWTETQSVTTAKGVFNVNLGSVTPLDVEFDAAYWLGVTVGSGSEMLPRVALTAGPYSLRSVNADTAAWLATDFGATGSLQTATPLGNGPGFIFHAPNGERRDIFAGNTATIIDYKLYVNSDGNVGVGTGSWPGGKLGVDGDVYVAGNVTKSYSSWTRSVISPIAFGTVNSTGTIITSTPNVTAAWNSSGSLYEITIDGVTYSTGDYIAIATPFGNGTAATGGGSGKLYVFIRDSGGTLSQIGFSFIVFKP